MSAEMLLVLERPRARITRDFKKGTFVALYDGGLEFQTPGARRQVVPELPKFGNDRHASIARLLEAVGGLTCPVCCTPLARDVWNSIELAAGHKQKCRHCEARIEVVETEYCGLVAQLAEETP